MVSILILVLLAAAAVLVWGIARWLNRQIPIPTLAMLTAVAVLPFPRAFVSDRTPLPLDHALYTVPWISLMVSPPHNPYLNDVATQILPWAKANRLAVRDGNLPLRDRWNGCGMPLASNSVSAAFSPLTLLGFLLPLARSYTLTCAIRLLLAAAGMWLWTREIGASGDSAAFAGVVFALSFSFTPPWLFFPQAAVLCLWPWLLFLVERLRDPTRPGRTLAALTGLFGVMELSGHPETAAMGFLFAGLWLAARTASREFPRPGRAVAMVAAAAVGAVGLTAFLLIPSIHAIAASGRLADAERPFWGSLLSLAPHGPRWQLGVTSLFPHTLGNAIQSPRISHSGFSFPELAMGYFGIVGWAAAALILRPGSRRSPVEWPALGLLLAGWGIAVAAWPVAEIFSHTPVIRYMFPPRLHSWEALAGPALAALELDRLRADWRDRPAAARLAVIVPIGLGLLAVAVFLRFRPEYAAKGGLRFQGVQLAITIGVLAAAALLFAGTRRHASAAVAALTILGGAELLYQWAGLFHLHSPNLLFPQTPLVAYLRRQKPPFRVAGEAAALFPSTNVFAGVEDIRTHDATERRDYLEFLDATCGYPYEYFKKIRNLDSPALDFLNVRYVVTGPVGQAPGQRWRLAYDGPDGRLFENGGVLPRAFAPERVRFVVPPGHLHEPLTDANAAFGAAFRELVALPDWGARAYVLSEREGEVINASIEISDYRESTNAASFRARVDGPGDGFVVLSLTNDGGWSARESSGTPVPVLRANGPFLAVKLDRGEHVLALRYSPPGFRAGAKISAVTAAAIAVFVLFGRRRRRNFLEPRVT